jgi:hypothetical protein
MRPSLFLASLAAAAFLAHGASAQTKPKAPTPTLDGLTPAARMAVVRKAKHVYHLPDGSYLDTTNFDTVMELAGRELYVFYQTTSNTQDGPRASPDGRIRWTETSTKSVPLAVRLHDSPEVRAWGLGVFDDEIHGPSVAIGEVPHPPPYVQWWRTPGSEPVSESWPRAHTGVLDSPTRNVPEAWTYLVPNPVTKLAAHEPFTSEKTETPGVVLLHVQQSKLRPRDKWVEDIYPDLFACEYTDRLFAQDRLKKPVGAMFVFPSFDDPHADTPRQRLAMVEGKRMPLFRIVAADDLRVSPEELAVAVNAGKLQLVVWSWKKIGDDREWYYKWTPQVVELKTKNGPAAGPATKTP